jgi:hypothetical protein
MKLCRYECVQQYYACIYIYAYLYIYMLVIKEEGLEMQANFCLTAGIYEHGYIYMYIYVYIYMYVYAYNYM